MDDFYFFDDVTIHIDKLRAFDLNAEENAMVKENLILSIDGTIMGVKIAAVEPYLKDLEVRQIRTGHKKHSGKFEVATADDFYKMLATILPLDID